VIEAIGPDVLTSCGDIGRVLQLNTVYVAGIGQECSRINEWTQLNEYTESEIEFLRRLRDEVACGGTAMVISVAMVIIFALFTIIGQ
jgi:hypothetical protein